MIRRLLSLGVMLIIGLLAYNMMFGYEADKENAKQITNGVKELIQSTKEKYKNGEYNEAIDRIGDVFNQLKNKADKLNNGEYADDISELEERKQRLEEMLRELEEKENTTTRSLVPQDLTNDKDAILKEMLELEKEVNRIATKLDKE
jgi:phosphopantetheine adenylyltransferase